MDHRRREEIGLKLLEKKLAREGININEDFDEQIEEAANEIGASKEEIRTFIKDTIDNLM